MITFHPSTHAALLLVATLGVSSAPAAQSMGDPTRPPNVTAGTDNAESEPAAYQLQSVLIAPGRKVAIVNGETVHIGEKVGDAVVRNISESGVVLQYPDRSETLKLTGDIKRRPVRRPPSPASPGTQGGTR
jgi:MSHA biogenesis protein MshK